MKRLITSFVLALAGLAAAPFASATVVGFDDLPDGALPANYGGLDWSAGDWTAYGFEQAPFTPHSGAMRISTSYGDDDTAATFGLGAGNTFQGAWFSGYEDVSVTFELYENGALVATSAALVTSATPTWLSSGYAGLVDTVVVSSADQSYFSMDDVTFAAAVPEPGSIVLMAGGLLALATVARRRA